MALIVQKFGGTSVADPERIKRAALKTKAELDRGHHVAVVVSAMSGVTNQLVGYCDTISPMHDYVEYDAVVSAGEQITSGLFALALQQLGIEARSWMGWQLPVLTSDAHGKARILDIKTDELKITLLRGEVGIMAGFQGVNEDGRITTLGRGGSDTSAVALAAALGAERCDIYTDVDGVYTTDPRIVSNARKITKISYEEMLEMASVGAKVLQTRSVEIAMKQKVRVQVLSSFDNALGSDLPGTLVLDEDEIMEQPLVNGIAYNRDEAKVTLSGVENTPGVAARIFGPLADANVNVDMIVQDITVGDAPTTNITFTAPQTDLPRVLKIFEVLKAENKLKFDHLFHDSKVSKVSVIGVGMKSHAGVALTMFRELAAKSINIQVISTSEIKISVLIAEEYTELAVRSLHAAYGLDNNVGME